jgi:hypothetical protein
VQQYRIDWAGFRTSGGDEKQVSFWRRVIGVCVGACFWAGGVDVNSAGGDTQTHTRTL